MMPGRNLLKKLTSPKIAFSSLMMERGRTSWMAAKWEVSNSIPAAEI
jgi:hypothetical protein